MGTEHAQYKHWYIVVFYEDRPYHSISIVESRICTEPESQDERLLNINSCFGLMKDICMKYSASGRTPLVNFTS